MTDQPLSSPVPPAMRASNDDREQVARVLQKAMSEGRITVAELESRLDSVYAAKTVDELIPVTKDLPGHGLSMSKPAPVAVSHGSAPMVSISSSPAPKANLVAIMSGSERKGVWHAPTQINAVAIMGGVEINFTQAQLSGMETVINATAFWGGIEITVPEGITVKVEGIGVMGGYEDKVNQHYGPEAPVIRVRGVAIMGGVEVRRPRVNELPR